MYTFSIFNKIFFCLFFFDNILRFPEEILDFSDDTLDLF